MSARTIVDDNTGEIRPGFLPATITADSFKIPKNAGSSIAPTLELLDTNIAAHQNNLYLTTDAPYLIYANGQPITTSGNFDVLAGQVSTNTSYISTLQRATGIVDAAPPSGTFQTLYGTDAADDNALASYITPSGNRKELLVGYSGGTSMLVVNPDNSQVRMVDGLGGQIALNNGNIQIDAISMNSITLSPGTAGVVVDGTTSILYTDQIRNREGAFGTTGQILTASPLIPGIMDWADNAALTAASNAQVTADAAVATCGAINLSLGTSADNFTAGTAWGYANSGFTTAQDAASGLVTTNASLGASSDAYPTATAWAYANYGISQAGAAQRTANTALAQSGVTGVNTLTGSIGLMGGTGITILAATPTITITNAGVTSIAEQTGDINLNAGNGISVVSVPGNISVSNSGVLSVVAGTAIGVSAGTGDVTINNKGVASAVAGTGIGVSAGTGDVTISNTGVTSVAGGTGIGVSSSTGDVTIKNTIPQMEGKYNTNIAALALTGSYATMVTMSFVSTEPNANLFAWGQLDFLAGGTGSVVSARLIINGNPAQVITIAAPNNHQQQVVCLGSGVAPAVPGSFVVALQALVSSGSASRLAASVMCFGNHVLSV